MPRGTSTEILGFSDGVQVMAYNTIIWLRICWQRRNFFELHFRHVWPLKIDLNVLKFYIITMIKVRSDQTSFKKMSLNTCVYDLFGSLYPSVQAFL